MKKEVFILFQTDNWKSNSSRVLLGVFSSEEKAKRAYTKKCFDEDKELKYMLILSTNLNEFYEQ